MSRWITDYHNPRLSPLRLPTRPLLSPHHQRRIRHTTRKLRNHQCRCLFQIHSTRATRSCPHLRLSTPDATAITWVPRRLQWGRATKETGAHSHKHQVRASSLCLGQKGVSRVAVAAGMNDSLNRRVQASSHATVRAFPESADRREAQTLIRMVKFF